MVEPLRLAISGTSTTGAAFSISSRYVLVRPESLLGAVRNAVDLWTTDPAAWKAMVERAMTRAFTWERAAREYLELYGRLGREWM